jgi:ABC-type uncharacterized transport system permease subunit
MPLLLVYAAVISYFAAAAWQVRALAGDAGGTTRLPAGLALLGAAAHAGSHLTAWHAGGGPDMHFFAALSLISLGTAALTAELSLSRPIGALGVMVYPLAALLLLLYHHGTVPATTAAMGWQIQLHAWLSLLAYAALSLAALLAVMLWAQERGLRQRRFGRLLQVFPPLTLIEALMFRLIGAGFALLTLSLLTGVVFVADLFAQHLVHKTVLSLLAWVVFGVLLLGRVRYGWRGRRAVRLTLVAMALLGLGFFGSKFVLEVILARGA